MGGMGRWPDEDPRYGSTHRDMQRKRKKCQKEGSSRLPYETYKGMYGFLSNKPEIFKNDLSFLSIAE